MQKQARHRRRKKNNISRDCCTTYWAADEGTSEPKNIQQDHVIFSFKDHTQCTLNTVQSSKKKLQRDENLQQQPVFNNQLTNVRQDPPKCKTRIPNLPTIQSNKKEKGKPYGPIILYYVPNFYKNLVLYVLLQGCKLITMIQPLTIALCN